MKYFIYSPIGRTGSKRIFDPITETCCNEADNRTRYSLTYGTLWKLGDGETVKIEGEADIVSTLDNTGDPIAVHSHNDIILPTDAEPWTFILSGRKRKIDSVLSRLLANKSGSSHPMKSAKEGFEAFEADLEEVDSLIEYYIEKEYEFVNSVKALGKEPVVVYMEDDFATLQEKVGVQFDESLAVHDTHTKSIYKAVDYITNYDAIQAMYDENLSDYQSRFFSDTE